AQDTQDALQDPGPCPARIPRCWRARHQLGNHRPVRQPAALVGDRAAHRAHLDREVVRPHQQLHHQPIAGDDCHWRVQPAGPIPGRLPFDGLLLAHRHQGQGR
ncbi:hypothetical protein LTR53_020023, partial [Teratosphaeriaceae sp. CCFEE 6253]